MEPSSLFIVNLVMESPSSGCCYNTCLLGLQGDYRNCMLVAGLNSARGNEKYALERGSLDK